MSARSYNGYMSEMKSATTRTRGAAARTEAPAGAARLVGVRELRDHLSEYLQQVRAGTPLTVTEHGRPIATIVPRGFSLELLDLAARGIVTLPGLPKGDPSSWPRVPVDGGTDDLVDWAKGEQLP